MFDVEGVDQRTPMEFLIEHTGEEAVTHPLGVDHPQVGLPELPVAGEGERDFVLPAAELLRFVTPRKSTLTSTPLFFRASTRFTRKVLTPPPSLFFQ